MNKDIDEDEVLEKEINQLDKIDVSVEQTIKDMGTIWKSCLDKLEKDGICFLCKEEIKDNSERSVVIVPEDKIDKGIFCLASICNKCRGV